MSYTAGFAATHVSSTCLHDPALTTLSLAVEAVLWCCARLSVCAVYHADHKPCFGIYHHLFAANLAVLLRLEYGNEKRDVCALAHSPEARSFNGSCGA